MTSFTIRALLFMAAGLAVFAFSCRKIKLCDDISPCMKKVLRQESLLCKDASVDIYLFQGERVFVVNPGTCGNDLTSSVYDEQCNFLCYLGGFAGIDTCLNVSFSQEAEFVRRCEL